MDDLISRQAAIDSLHMHLMYRMGTDSNKKRLDEWINNLPSAQTDIILCKDCKHRPTRDEDGWLDFPTERCPCQNEDDFYYSWMPKDDWFCGNAERRR